MPKRKHSSMESYEVIIDNESFEISEEELNQLDITQVSDDSFHILENHTGYDIELLSKVKKQLRISINGSIYNVTIKDRFDRLVQDMGLSVSNTQNVGSVMAPMPGLILKVLVEQGQSIEEGDPLVILEAMKMENILKATGSGVVKKIGVGQGDAVEKSQVLIEME